MSMVRCPTCNKKIDTSFYGACLDCGTMLPIEGQSTSAPMPAPEPVTASQHDDTHEPATPNPATEPAGPGLASRIGGGLLIRLVLVGIFLGGGAIWGFFTNADRSDGGAIIEAGTLDADELQVGDCLDWPGSGGDDVEVFDSVRARPCTEPHDMEVYAVLEYPSVSGTSWGARGQNALNRSSGSTRGTYAARWCCSALQPCNRTSSRSAPSRTIG